MSDTVDPRRKKRKLWWAWCLWMAAGGLGSGLSWAADLASGGYVSGESRFFPEAPAFPGQARGPQNGFVLQPQFDWTTRGQSLGMTLFYRYDAIDDARTHFDVREMLWQVTGNDIDFALGVGQVFWGVTESRHLVDIINQVDYVEDVDLEERLGQPMLRITREQSWGVLSAYVLPGFRERVFPGEAGRLRPAYPVAMHDARYASEKGDRHVDFALRYAHVLGDWDVGMYLFRGTGREPRLVPDGNRLLPYYDIISQWGTDLQLTLDNWLWKFEGIVREGQGRTFAAVVGGGEYTLYQLAESDADLGLLFEILYDGRDPTAPPTLFDRDVFLAMRLILNDIDNTALLAGIYQDLRKDEQILIFEAERRLGDHWRFALDVRTFAGSASSDPFFQSIERDDYLRMRLMYYF